MREKGPIFPTPKPKRWERDLNWEKKKCTTSSEEGKGTEKGKEAEHSGVFIQRFVNRQY